MDGISSDMLTMSQVGRELGVSSERVRQLVKAGKLPATWTPLGRLVRSDDVAALRKEREVTTGDKARLGAAV